MCLTLVDIDGVKHYYIISENLNIYLNIPFPKNDEKYKREKLCIDVKCSIRVTTKTNVTQI